MADIKYTVIDQLGTLGEDKKGWMKEVNIMTWGNRKTPIIDVRSWNRDADKMGKGTTLGLAELKDLKAIGIDNIIEALENSMEE